MSKESKTLSTILLVIIVVIVFFWYRSDNARLKRIEKLNDQIIEYEEKIEELERQNKSKEEELEYYREK